MYKLKDGLFLSSVILKHKHEMPISSIFDFIYFYAECPNKTSECRVSFKKSGNFQSNGHKKFVFVS